MFDGIASRTKPTNPRRVPPLHAGLLHLAHAAWIVGIVAAAVVAFLVVRHL